jgi:hypothetical protein
LALFLWGNVGGACSWPLTSTWWKVKSEWIYIPLFHTSLCCETHIVKHNEVMLTAL